jgi:hypothetical protein
MAGQTPEGKVKKKVTDLLKEHGIWYFFPANNGFGRAGIPDIVAIVDGIFVGIECKADETKKPTALQSFCGVEIRKAGGYWFLVNGENSLEVLTSFIKRNKRC